MERDAEALEEFKAVVKKRATNTGSHFNPEGKGLSGWDEERKEYKRGGVPYRL